MKAVAVYPGKPDSIHLAKAAVEYPGWAERLLTHPVKGLDNYRQLIDTLKMAHGAIKVYMEIAPLDGAD